MPARLRLVTGAVIAGLLAASVFALSAASQAAVTPGVKPDFELRPDQRASKTIDFSAIANVAGAVEFQPDGCRTDPSSNLFCDALRIKLHRSTAPDARNLVRVLLTWDPQASVPDLALVAAGLGVGQLPDLDLYAYEKSDAPLGYDTEDDDADAPGCQGCEGVGGRGVVIPEILGFTAVQDEYDIVIQSGTGVLAGGYTMTVVFTDELFDKPGEFLEDVSAPGQPAVELPPDFSLPPGGGGGGGFSDGAIEPELPALDLAPINPDADIAGIGLGVNEQFDANQLSLGGATRNTAAVSKAPSGIVLLFALGLVPIAMGVGAVGVLRRRRQSLF